MSTQQTSTKPSALGNVYAKALIALAQEQGKAESVAQEVTALLGVVAGSRDLQNLFASPALRKEDREAIVRRVFAGQVSDLVLRFLLVVAGKGRLAQLGEILASVQSGFAHLRGEVDVLATVPAALDSAATDALRAEIGRALGKTVVLTTKVEPKIIGGMTLRVGDQLIDASVATRLKKLNGRLAEAGRAYAKTAVV